MLPEARTLILTATASPTVIKKFKDVLQLDDNCTIVSVSPNRHNIFLEKATRLADCYGDESFKRILVPLAEELNAKRELFPLTIIYMKLKCMITAIRVFTDIVKAPESQNGDMRLFTVFHSETTTMMKSRVIRELGEDRSFVRVVFATTALGMGVDTRFVKQVIHISPSSTMESYFQEIGRAGRSGGDARAILYYNNADIASNRDNVDSSMKNFCSAVGCLRAYILQHFGHKPISQQRCCSSCHPDLNKQTVVKDETTQFPVHMCPHSHNLSSLRTDLEAIVSEFNKSNELGLYGFTPVENTVIDQIIDSIPTMVDQTFFTQFGIWDDDYMLQMYDVVCQFCPAL